MQRRTAAAGAMGTALSKTFWRRNPGGRHNFECVAKIFSFPPQVAVGALKYVQNEVVLTQMATQPPTLGAHGVRRQGQFCVDMIEKRCKIGYNKLQMGVRSVSLVRRGCRYPQMWQ